MAQDSANLIKLTADIVSSYVLNNSTPVSAVPALINATHGALASVQSDEVKEGVQTKATAAQIRRSITSTALFSFEDGKPYKMLKRHLTTRGLTAVEYKDKWGLPSDYPMTAQTYSEARSNLAKTLGLGQTKSKSKPNPKALSQTGAKSR